MLVLGINSVKRELIIGNFINITKYKKNGSSTT